MTAGTVTTVILAQPELRVRLAILVVRVTLVILVTMALTERPELVVLLVLLIRVTLAMRVTQELAAEAAEAEVVVLQV